MSETPKPIERPSNEIADVLIRMVDVCGKARALRKSGFRYATLDFVRDNEIVTPHVRAMHYEGDTPQDKDAPFILSVNSISENTAGIIFGGSGENGISPLVAPDGSTERHIDINASTGSEYMDPYTSLRAEFYPQGFDDKRLREELGDFEYHVLWARIHEYMYFGFSDGELHNPHEWRAEEVGYVLTILESVLTAIEDVHKIGKREPTALLLTSPEEIEGTISHVPEGTSLSRKKSSCLRRLFNL